MLRDAIKTGRIKIDTDERTKNQISRIPVSLNEIGKCVICSKKEMREKHNLKSPDRSDTYCFMYLANPETHAIENNNFNEEDFSILLN
jgi:hypothetical protein